MPIRTIRHRSTSEIDLDGLSISLTFELADPLHTSDLWDSGCNNGHIQGGKEHAQNQGKNDCKQTER